MDSDQGKRNESVGKAAVDKATVDWFNDSLGYGFGTTADGSKVFLHQRFIRTEGYRLLFEGDTVQFQVNKDERGREYASDIVRLAGKR